MTASTAPTRSSVWQGSPDDGSVRGFASAGAGTVRGCDQLLVMFFWVVRQQLQARAILQAELELVLQRVQRTEFRTQRIGVLVQDVGALVHFAVDALFQRLGPRLQRCHLALVTR